MRRRCEQPGCDQPALPDERFCFWHPSLDLDHASRGFEREPCTRHDRDPWSRNRSALERHPSAIADGAV